MDTSRSCLLQQENNLQTQQPNSLSSDNQSEIQSNSNNPTSIIREGQKPQNNDKINKQLQKKMTMKERYEKEDQSDESDEGFEDAQNEDNKSLGDIDEMENLQGDIAFSIPNVEARNFKKQKDFLPLPPILDQQYSLIPDMISGWRPKFGKEQLPPPIPLCFEDENLDYIIDKLQKTQRYTILYLGLRPKTSYDFHREYSGKGQAYNFKYGNILLQREVLSQFNVQIESDNNTQKNNNNHLLQTMDNQMQRKFIGMNPEYPQNLMHFDSSFESGNLDCVVKLSNTEYDLFMRVDTNTKGHLQWYYFKVTNTQKGQTIKFNIQNFTKKRSLYQRGLRPFVKSMQSYNQKQIDWKQDGFNVNYQQRKLLKYDYKISKQQYNFIKKPKIYFFQYLKNRKNYYTLSFEYKFENDEDEVYFAQIPPYTYSYLINIIKPLSFNQLNNDGRAQFLIESSLCKSLSGIPVQLLTITDYNDQSIPLTQRKVLVIIARQHPGETTGSWMCQGLIESLLSQNNEIQQLRKKVIFKIIPMMNPDGVIVGNYRTSLAGLDLNRQFGDGGISDQNSQLFPSVSALKQLIKNLKEQYGNNMLGFLDLHGHSIKKNIFTFGPYYPPTDFRYYRSKFIPKLIEKKSNYFRYYSCTYNSQKSSKETARVAFMLKFNLEICYTIESTFGLYYKDDTKKTEQMSISDWINFGSSLPLALKEYIEMMETYSIIKEAQEQKCKQRRLQQQERSQNISPLKRQQSQSPNRANSIYKLKSNNIKDQSEISGDFIPFDESQIYNLGGILKEIQNQERQLVSQQANQEELDHSDNYSDSQADSEPSDEDISTDQRNKLFSNIGNYQKNFTKFVMGQKKTEKLVIEGGQDKRDKIITHKLKRTAISVDRESKKKKGKKKNKKNHSIEQLEFIGNSQQEINNDNNPAYSNTSIQQWNNHKNNIHQTFIDDNDDQDMSGLFLADLKKKKKQRSRHIKVQNDLSYNNNIQQDQLYNVSYNDQDDYNDNYLNQYKIKHQNRKFNTQMSQDYQNQNMYSYQNFNERDLSPLSSYIQQTSNQQNNLQENDLLYMNQQKFKNNLPHLYKKIPKNRVPMKLNIICDKFQTSKQNGSYIVTPSSNIQQQQSSPNQLSQDQQYPVYIEQARNQPFNNQNQQSSYLPSNYSDINPSSSNDLQYQQQIISSALKNSITHRNNENTYQKQMSQNKNSYDYNVKQSNEIKLPQIENRQVRAFNQGAGQILNKTNQISIYQMPILDQQQSNKDESDALKKEILRYKRESHHNNQGNKNRKDIQNLPVYSVSPNLQRSQNSMISQQNSFAKSGVRISTQYYQNQNNNLNNSINTSKLSPPPKGNNNYNYGGVTKSQNSIDMDDVNSNLISSHNRSQHYIGSLEYIPDPKQEKYNSSNLEIYNNAKNQGSNLDILNNILTNPSMILSQNYGHTEQQKFENISDIITEKKLDRVSKTQDISSSPIKINQNLSITMKNIIKETIQNNQQTFSVKDSLPITKNTINQFKMKQLTKKQNEYKYDSPLKEKQIDIKNKDKYRNQSEDNGGKKNGYSVNQDRRSSIQNNQGNQQYNQSNQNANNLFCQPNYIQLIEGPINNSNNSQNNNGSLKQSFPLQSTKSKHIQLQFLQNKKLNIN